MAELRPIPFLDLLRRMRREVAINNAVFDLPTRKWWIPDGELDYSALHFRRRAATPVGPAAGPHTQLAQNIVLAWLAGSRIIELKTVQINDRLTIPRPCIHVPNVGFNVEWSQELLVEQSILEYAKAVYFIEILKHTRGFGVFETGDGFDTVYDISVGYDLEGIQSEKVTGFLEALRHPAPFFDRLREQLPSDLAAFRDLPLPDVISDCVTLSTFHGCPADQIEAIGHYLIEERGLHTIIKLNPTLLGFDTVREILVDRLGYTHLDLRRDAFEHDLQYDDGLTILRNLRDVAERRGSTIGAKFTNTLVVANDPAAFPSQADPYMYVSGPPLHVISMTLMQRFREDVGFEFPVSFSAGIDAKNFPAAVACGMVPVTTCTDLLRQGGYGRLPAYLRALGSAMRTAGVTSREAYVLAAHGHGAAAAESAVRSLGGEAAWDRCRERAQRAATDKPNALPDVLRDAAADARVDPDALVMLAVRTAGHLNGRDIVPPLVAQRRYHASANRKPPRRIDSRLDLYDCINCDLCISACPNDAIFAYTAVTRAEETQVLTGTGDGGPGSGKGFVIRDEHQLAVLEGACNECSNCEVYCPEDGAPFVVKERVFLSPQDFASETSIDGFCREHDVLHARIDGREFRLTLDEVTGTTTLEGPGISLVLDWKPLEVTQVRIDASVEFDTALLWRMKTVWDTIFNASTPNMVQPEPVA